MSDSEKALRAIALGSFAGLPQKSATEHAIEKEMSLVKLAGLGGMADSTASLIARGLTSSATSQLLKVAAGSSIGHPTKDYSLIEKAMGNSIGQSSYARAIEAAGKLASLAHLTHPNGVRHALDEATMRLHRPFDHPGISATTRAALGLDSGAIGALSRSQHWANAIASLPGSQIDKLLGMDKVCREQAEAISLAASGLKAATVGIGPFGAVRSSDMLARLAGLETTTAKMSLFAGAVDVLGPGSIGSSAAYEALLGGYSSSDAFSRRYLRDREERMRLYRDLDVDDGLIEADNAATVAVLVESGVVEGTRTRNGTMIAVVEAGPVRMRIMASRPKIGAFVAIDTFEIALRAFVSMKLGALHGPNWFKQRVPGDLVGRAKERRREAMRSGEASLDLIHYVDLGDLIAIILRKDNWAELFEAVFDRPEPLRVDLERLTANRRPTMHSRPIDPVQLCEIVLIIKRLTSWMELDGGWDAGWDDDI